MYIWFVSNENSYTARKRHLKSIREAHNRKADLSKLTKVLTPTIQAEYTPPT